MAIWTLYRTGKFTANLVEKNKCGRPGQNEFRYEIELCTTSLDSQNFIVDNFEIPKAFDHFRRDQFEASCEQLVAGVVLLLFKLAGGSPSNPTKTPGRSTRIKVKVMPINNADESAGAAFEWLKGEPLPTNLPINISKQLRQSAKIAVSRKPSYARA